ncbi:MAG TPA: ABC transporter permease subunit [Candidatus Limnocylindrales bacterium]|nr:ABC transporter permease subunit [Candidatus Limnocylindrales bacterium]
MIFVEIALVTLRALLGRRRTLLMLLLAGIPILVGLIVRANGPGVRDVAATLDGLVVRVVLPLVALVFGTAALGSELEDGTAVHLLTKPIRRSTIVLAKTAVAGTLTAAMLVPSTMLAGILLARPGTDSLATTFALALGILAGSYLYVAIFVALSIVTSRGLLIGLGYALIWEGILAGLLPGSQVFSVREYVRGIAQILSPDSIESVVGTGAAMYAAIALVAATVIASLRLAAYEVRGGD